MPVEGGHVRELRPFLNVRNERDFQLICHYLIATFRPRGAYIILWLVGVHGGGKSIISRVVRRLTDPSRLELGTVPRSEHDLMIRASNSHMVVLDNIRHFPAWLPDAMCRLATGGGLATRELYYDNDEVGFNVKRPQVINSIKEVITNPDFLDRAITISPPDIKDTRRQIEERFWEDFDKAKCWCSSNGASGQ